MKSIKLTIKVKMLFACIMLLATAGFAQEEKEDYRLAARPFTIEYSYKIKLGFFGEFYSLYKKNHLPFIKSSVKSGHILNVKVYRPFNHPGESDRWDLRVIVTYKNALIAHGLDSYDFEKERKELFPDKEDSSAKKNAVSS